MAMRIEEHNVDMRVIRLFQKNVRERGRFSAESRLMFSHYDAIEVSPVFDQDEKFCGYGAEGKWIAFNEKYVSEFWSKEQHPLFFCL